jgi:hypothetical protein
MSEAPEAAAAAAAASAPTVSVPLQSRYRACLILANVGDAVGYYNGRWEFRLSTQAIHDELDDLTGGRGMAKLKVIVRDFCH